MTGFLIWREPGWRLQYFLGGRGDLRGPPRDRYRRFKSSPRGAGTLEVGATPPEQLRLVRAWIV